MNETNGNQAPAAQQSAINETLTEISVDEIETRENAASQTMYCCIVNIAF